MKVVEGMKVVRNMVAINMVARDSNLVNLASSGT